MVIPLTYGRMGNFLFQAATAMAYAWDHGLEFTLPNTTTSRHDNPIYLQHLVHPAFNPKLHSVKLTEQAHGYIPLPFTEEWRAHNITLDGYWQSEKYFGHHRAQLLKMFGYGWTCWKGFVSVHVRRGDYLQLTRKHPPVPAEWMLKAMALFPGHHFIFFSDDIKWCKDTFGRRKDVSFSEGKNEEGDLIAMTWCEHQICSASTFSWWGAYLNQNPEKRIIMPNHWFTPNYRGLDTRDIVPDSWERL